jgi:hypothetical protein
MVTTAITIVPMGIMAIGDTDTMALGPIADTGRAVHIVDGADRRFQKPDGIGAQPTLQERNQSYPSKKLK